MKEVITKRSFNVPVELLYQAWANSEHLKNWWGPNGFTNTFHEFDFRPEGRWQFVMHSADGKNYVNESIFKTIIENELIVFEHLSNPQYRAEFYFTGDGNSSRLEWKMIFEKENVYQSLKDFVAEKNEENLNRLEEELKKI